MKLALVGVVVASCLTGCAQMDQWRESMFAPPEQSAAPKPLPAKAASLSWVDLRPSVGFW